MEIRSRNTRRRVCPRFSPPCPMVRKASRSIPAGNLYAANLLNNTIEKFTPGGGRSVFANASVLNGPMGLAVDSAGNLYAGNYFGNRIIKFTPAGVPSVFASSGLSGPIGLAFDGGGNLYVANSGSGSIQRFTPGGVGSPFGSGRLAFPAGLAFDTAGNFYVANYNGSFIEKFTPDGTGTDFVTTGLSGPSFMTIIPEPAPAGLLSPDLPHSSWRDAAAGGSDFVHPYYLFSYNSSGLLSAVMSTESSRISLQTTTTRLSPAGCASASVESGDASPEQLAEKAFARATNI